MTPAFGTDEYWRYAVLFNDITLAPTAGHLLFSDRKRLCDHLWAQGWRREVRPEDSTDRCVSMESDSRCSLTGEHEWHDDGRGRRWKYDEARS